MRALIVGAGGGIGQALSQEILRRHPDAEIIAGVHNSSPCPHPNITELRIDVMDETQIARLFENTGDLDLIVNAVGVLHAESQGPEKTIKHVDPGFFIHNMQINTLPSILLAKHGHGSLRHGRPAVFATVSAKVGSIEDNQLGGWTSYRCSKAALNMALKNISIEWRRSLPQVCVAALHPGTTDTALSKPFQKNVKAEKLFSPEKTAGLLMDVIETLDAETTGGFWSWDGRPLPW